MELGSAGFPGIMMESRKRYRVGAPDGGYMELATLYGSTVYLEPWTKEIPTKMGQLGFSPRRVTARLSRGSLTNCGAQSTGSEY